MVGIGEGESYADVPLPRDAPEIVDPVQKFIRHKDLGACHIKGCADPWRFGSGRGRLCAAHQREFENWQAFEQEK